MSSYVLLTAELKAVRERGQGRFVDSGWFAFLSKCGLTPLILGDTDNGVDPSLFSADCVKGSILIGGGNISGPYASNADPSQVKESHDNNREKLEFSLITQSIAVAKPIVGICRGMQAIGCYFGARLHGVSKHAATRHQLTSVSESEVWRNLRKEVNSYHDYAFLARELPPALISIAENGEVVEAFRHRDFPIYGMMWHPEREIDFADADINFFRRCFNS